VRAAVAVLERDGLISVRRGRGGGFIVQAPTYDTVEQRHTLRRNRVAVRDAFDFRSIVESGAARLAADRRRQTDITHLRALVGTMNDALHTSLDDQTPQHVAEFQALDSAFHLGIAEAAQNADLAGRGGRGPAPDVPAGRGDRRPSRRPRQ
jgi:GntR family transcriptional repressor for pyruvate dehydrogenase complex